MDALIVRKGISKPEEEKTVSSPDFSSGNIVVTPTAGKVMTQVTVNKDTTNHVADNIKSGVTLYGVEGSYEGSTEEITQVYKVVFIDYDGTVLKTQYIESGGTVTAPTSPSHTGLTFVEWNNDLTNITCDLCIGAVFDTTDEKTHIFFDCVPSDSLTISVCLKKSNNDQLTISWGDGTSDYTTTTSGQIQGSTISHTYASYGTKEITIWMSSGTGTWQPGGTYNYWLLGSNTTAKKTLVKEVWLGTRITDAPRYMFYETYGLKKIVLGRSLTALGYQTIDRCTALRALVIPREITTISETTGSAAVYQNYGMVYLSYPNNALENGGLSSHKSLKMANFNIISIRGSASFGLMYSMEGKIKINSTTSGTSNFSMPSAYGVEEIELNVLWTNLVTTCFQYCHSVKKITLSNTITSISSYVFAECHNLREVNIPSALTSIGDGAFTNCYNLDELDFPSTLTTISASCFSGAICPRYIFRSTTPPSLASSDAFNGIQHGTKIYVPDDSVSTYKAATNWSTCANYIYPLSDIE